MGLLISACTNTSSTWQTTPSKPSSTRLISFWKCSEAEQIANGNLLKQYLPKGVRNVVTTGIFHPEVFARTHYWRQVLKILGLLPVGLESRQHAVVDVSLSALTR